MTASLTAIGLVLWSLLSVQQSPEAARPSTRFLRDFVCRLDTASGFDWRQILSTLPGGVTFGQERTTRDADFVLHSITFETPFLKGSASWSNGSTPSGGRLKLESDIGPLFETADGPREFLIALGTTAPVPFDADVLRSAFSTYTAAPADGLMAGSFGRRVSPFSGTTRMEIDYIVAVDIKRNFLEARLSSRPRMRLCS
jgi:hypothetical protein